MKEKRIIKVDDRIYIPISIALRLIKNYSESNNDNFEKECMNLAMELINNNNPDLGNHIMALIDSSDSWEPM